MLSRFFLVLPLLAVAQPAGAALVWRERVVEVKAAPLDEKVEAVWTFTNTGKTTVTIGFVQSSCGCTVPRLGKRAYAPGESGEIRAVFTFGEREGRQEKEITVPTDEPGQPSYELTLKVDIPRLFEMNQRFVFWRLNSEPVAKTIELRALYPDVALPKSVEVRDQRFLATLDRDPEKPDVFRIVVTPTTTTGLVQASIIVRTEPPAGTVPSGELPVVTLYGLVR